MRTLISLTLFLSLTSSLFFKLTDLNSPSFTKTTIGSTMDFKEENANINSFAFADPLVFIKDTFLVEGNIPAVDTLIFVVERTDATTGFQVSYIAMDSTAHHLDGDYGIASGLLTFDIGGALTTTIKVPVFADNKVELDEYLKVKIFAIQNASGPTMIGNNIAIGTIKNDDIAYLSIRDTMLIEGDTGVDSLRFVVDLNGELDTAFSFFFNTMDSTALHPPDYLLQGGIRTGSGTGTGTFFAGIDTISIGVFGETKTELDEHFKVLLSNIDAGGRSVFFTDSLAIGTIKNNDTSVISIADASIIEGDTGVDTLTFVVSLDQMVDSLGISYMTMDGTASVTTDMDYVQKVDTIYMNCALTNTIKIAIKGDTIIELDEYFKLALLEIFSENRTVSFIDSLAVGTIINDDFDPSIIDPCECLSNETSNGAKDGQFAETIQVTSQTGETWYIASANGLYQSPSGVFPPAKGGNSYPLNPFITGVVGQKLTESALGNGFSHYTLQGIHVDDLGYVITVTNGAKNLTIGNTCHYEKACNQNQTFAIPFFSKVSGKVKIDDCTANNKFISDGEHLYRDNIPRQSEITICPNITGQILTATFQSFDLAIGDTLFVYDGQNTFANFIAKGSGNSVSSFNGGWVSSNCDPNVNASGCLTFALKTNGDNKKGAGWEATINCALQGITTLNRVNDIYASAKCDSLTTSINLRIPTINASSSDCVLTNDSIIVSYCDVRDTLKAGQLTYPVFPFGTYNIDYKLMADTTITTSNTVHVYVASLTCNDTVTTTIGQGCVSMIQPDDILEGACDTTSASMNLFYTVKVQTDAGLVVGTSPNYPILDASKNGNVKCNTFYKVTVIRTLQVTALGCSQNVIDSCSGVVKLIDGIKPVFVEVKDDTIYGCPDMGITQNMLKQPTAIDNCEIDKLVADIPSNLGGACEAYNNIVVTWTAYDLCGNTSVATQNIIIKRTNALAIPKDTIISCGVSISPDVTGWPKIDSDGDNIGDYIITNKAAYCNFELSYTDNFIPGTCGSNSSILRIFTLFDNCFNIVDPIFADTQYILIRDTIAPIVNCPASNALGSQSNPYLFRTAYNSCTGLPGTIILPKGSDACDANLTTNILGVFRVKDQTLVAKNLAAIKPLEIGEYKVTFALKDDCGNSSDICNIYFKIADQTIPTAICTDELVVSLANGNLTINAEDISGGSFDACGIDTILIRRTICGNPNEYPADTNYYVAGKFLSFKEANGWSSSIEIGCCDMNTSIKVQLLVFDKGGNYNKCWLIISPENQPQAVCGNLPNAEGYCNDYATSHIGLSTDTNGNKAFDDSEWQKVDPNLLDVLNAQFGNPACNANGVCTNTSIEQEYQLLKQPCGVQTMKRRFRTKGLVGQTSNYPWYYQNVVIKYRPGWSFTFPQDTIFQCGTTDVGNIPEMLLLVNNGTCDQIAWEVKDEIFETEDGSCFKILRQWYVINACQHSDVQQPFELPRDQTAGKVTGNSNRTFTSKDTVNGVALNTQGYFSYTQLIIVMDNDAPIITIADVDTCIVGVPDAAPFNQADQTPGAAPFECDTLRLFSATGMDCTASNLLDFRYEVFDEGVRVAFGEGNFIYHVVQPNRTYRVRFTASDNCGNSGFAEKTFTFRDCRRPTALCQGINIGLDNNQMARVSAQSINSYSYDNCTDSSNLDLRIWHPSLGTAVPTNIVEVLALPTFVILNCNDRAPSTANLYVIDEAQNYDLCSTTIVVEDNLNLCPANRPTISGSIQTIDGNMVEQVQVLITGSVDMPEMITTNNRGTYSYEVAKGANYLITPKKDKNPLNGVSTFDLVLMQKHILGINNFDSPYKYIAADINQSGSVTAYDMVILRQMILNILIEFPNNESWRFINTASPMEAPNPLTGVYHEYYSVTEIKSNMAADFMAVKVGDVNGNANPNSLLINEERNFTSTLDFHLTDRQVETGKTYTLDFSVNDLEQLLGYQFTLAFEGLTFDNWNGGLVDKNYFGTTLTERGFLTTSWNRKNESILPEDALFKLKFTAYQDGILSDMLSINSKFTEAEAYNMEAELLAVQLVFDEAEIPEIEFELYQNRPNPFNEQTQINFYLSEDSKATLTIMDITGKVIKTISNSYQKGRHSVTIDRSDLPTSGMLFYQLESSAGKMTKTMLVLD